MSLEQVLTVAKSKSDWYKQGVNYWVNTEATIDGVLGGFGKISAIDIKGSQDFIRALPKIELKGNCADCGGGVGRISQDLLCPIFKSVDLIDPTPHYIEAAKKNLADVETMGRFYQLGLEQWYVYHFYYHCYI